MAKAQTLGDVLYADPAIARGLEAEWIALVERIAARDEQALHALYERSRRPVYTLAVRLTGSRETAEEVTVDVFHDVWRRAAGYDPANGTVLGWIMNQARSRAIDRLRHDQRKKRRAEQQGAAEAEPAVEVPDPVDAKERSRQLGAALASLDAREREAVEAAYFSELTHSEVARRLHQPLGTIKTRIRSALQKLRLTLAREGNT